MEALRATRVLHAADQEPFPAPGRIRVITIANQKGGVGKTTSTVNLGVALALYGLRTLVIDLDPQGNTEHGAGCRAHRRDAVGVRRPGRRQHAHRGGPPDHGQPAAPLRARHDRPRRRRDRARLRRRPRAPAAPGDRGAHRRPGSRGAAALRPHRLPAVAGPADAQRARGRRRGAHPDPVRVLRARGSRAAALQHRSGAGAPEPGHRRPHDPADHVRRPDEARRPGGRRGPQPLRRAGAAGGHPPQRPRLRGAGLRPVGPHLRPGLARLDELRGGRAGARAARRRPCVRWTARRRPAARPLRRWRR